MNDDLESTEPVEPMEPDEVDVLDSDLASAGDGLRRSAQLLDAGAVVSSALHRQVVRARRTTIAVAALATLMVGGSFAFAATRPSDETNSTDVAADGGLGSSGDVGNGLSARAIVDALPAAPIDPHSVQLVSSVKQFDSCDALIDDLHHVGAAHIGSRGFGNQSFAVDSRFALAEMSGADSSARAAPVPAGQVQSAGGGETLGTNVIVDGVDEADVVKAVDNLVVEIMGRKLRVTDTTAAAIVGEVELAEPYRDDSSTSASVSSLIMDGRNAVVFGSESVTADPLPGDPSAARPQRSYLTVTFVDLADPANPTLIQRVRLEGRLVAVRRVESQIRLVTSSSLQDLPIVVPINASAVAPALEQNRLAVAGSNVDNWIPSWDTGDGTDESRLMDCNEVVVPDTFAGVEMTSMVQFATAGEFSPEAIGLLAPSENLTATSTDVVIGSHVWVDPIDQSGDFDDWATALHRFSFEQGAPTYFGSGAVDGSIRDEFSMSVLGDGTVGVVTADVLPWQQRDQADITVRMLSTDTDASTMTEIGSLVPVGAKNNLGGVRFIGDRLLMSSNDDLFNFSGSATPGVISVVDLTNRLAPSDAGSVSMVGPARYFHPLEDQRVLVLGETADKVGDNYRSGVHATLLDLSAAPQIVTVWERKNASTSANYDHHAFTWWGSRSLAGFDLSPQFYEGSEYGPPLAELLTVDGDGLVPREVQPREADFGRVCGPNDGDDLTCDRSGPPRVARVLVVDGAPWLYTSESLERLDPTSFDSTALVSLPFDGF